MSVLKSKILQARTVFYVFAAFLVLVFLTGGSSRYDVTSLALLRPLTVVIFGIGLWFIRPEDIDANKFIISIAGAIMILAAIQLLPLPTSVWESLPGRRVITEIDRTSGVTGAWRSWSMVPVMSINSMFALFVPVAALLLAIQLNRPERRMILGLMIGLGLLSGFVGLLQAIGSSESAPYLYRITNQGSAVGLFANRNHQAMMLSMLFPMLAVYASTGQNIRGDGKFGRLMMVSAFVILVPLLLITGSRAGIFIGSVGLLSAFWLYQQKPKPTDDEGRTRYKRIANRLIGISIAVFLGILTVALSRGEAISRLTGLESTADLRWDIWPQMLGLASTYSPFGTGTGSFAAIYQLYERDELLRGVYVNQMHNDLLDMYLTSGFFGVSLVFLWIIGCFRHIRVHAFDTTSRTAALFSKLGIVLAAMMLLGSLTDYPARSPILAVLFAVACSWMVANRHQQNDKGGTS